MVRFGGILILLFALISCAQIGTISGGAKDNVAPAIVSSDPLDGALNVDTRQIQIDFDEFVALVSPNENIILLPSNVRYETGILNKTLTLTMKDNLTENTTYSLYLNGAIKDITEGNDTLIQLVFSTGPELDSNVVQFDLKDAFTNNPKEGVTVALFDSLEQNSPVYFSKTDSKGFAKIRAIADGVYYYTAFEDLNKNKMRDANEAQYASEKYLVVDTNYRDTLKLRISVPKRISKNIDASFISPYILAIRKPHGFLFDSLNIGVLEFSQLQKDTISEDSIHLFLPAFYESLQLSIDTLSKKVRNKKDLDEITLLVNTKKEVLLPNDCCVDFIFDAPIDSIAFSNNPFTLFKPSDSTYQKLKLRDITISQNMLTFNTLTYNCENVIFQIDSGGVYGPSGILNSEIQTVLQRKEPESLGVLNINIKTIFDDWFVVLSKNGESIQQKNGAESSQIVSFEHLIPGNYSVHFVQDFNSNGFWDPFIPESYTAPEKRFSYGRKVAVKANFEHDIEFVIPQ